MNFFLQSKWTKTSAERSWRRSKIKLRYVLRTDLMWIRLTFTWTLIVHLKFSMKKSKYWYSKQQLPSIFIWYWDNSLYSVRICITVFNRKYKHLFIFFYSVSDTTLSVRAFVKSRAVCFEELLPLLTEVKSSLMTGSQPRSGLIIQKTDNEVRNLRSARIFYTPLVIYADNRRNILTPLEFL